MDTKALLATELRKIGLHELAAKAEAGVYCAAESDLALPELELARDLADVKTTEANALARRCVVGEFGPTDEELDRAAERVLLSKAPATAPKFVATSINTGKVTRLAGAVAQSAAPVNTSPTPAPPR